MKGLSFLFNDAESSSDYTESYYSMISQSNVLERERKEIVVTLLVVEENNRIWGSLLTS
jgi:hypothetical protein